MRLQTPHSSGRGSRFWVFPTCVLAHQEWGFGQACVSQPLLPASNWLSSHLPCEATAQLVFRGTRCRGQCRLVPGGRGKFRIFLAEDSPVFFLCQLWCCSSPCLRLPLRALWRMEKKKKIKDVEGVPGRNIPEWCGDERPEFTVFFPDCPSCTDVPLPVRERQ